MRQKKIDQDIRDREREFEHKQGHLDSKIEARLATEEKAIEANAALLKAQAATQVQQNAVIQAQLHAGKSDLRLLYTGAVCLISCGVVHQTALMSFNHTHNLTNIAYNHHTDTCPC